jgi:hypothetical protein
MNKGPMPLAGSGAVIVWNDIADEGRDEFFEWHARQHMPERLNVPGFLRGRRCIAVDASVEFLTLYEVADVDVLDSEVYRTRLAHPMAWSAKVMPHFRNNVRGGCRVRYTDGPVMGGFVLSLRIESDAERREALLGRLVDDVMPQVVREPRITGAHVCVNDPSLSGGQVGARQGRYITQPDVVVLVEGSTAQGVRTVGDRLLADARLAAPGARPGVVRGLYQLEYSLQKLEGAPVPAPSEATGWRSPH